jgi:hypothetical protein
MLKNIIRSYAVKAAAVAVLAALPASAQETIPSKTEFMSRYDFHISMKALSSDDRRFGWIGNVGGDMDLLDYVKGRASLLAEYEVVLGDELRPFDPNQGNYTFEGSTSWRLHKTEFAGVFHHLSRHLSDRTKVPAVAINSIEGRVLRRFRAGGFAFDTAAGAGKVVEHAFLDYTWRAFGTLGASHSLNGLFDWYSRTSVESFGTDAAIAGRTNKPTNGQIETGLRLKGKRGRVELFGGWEHRADAYPLERTGRSWAFAGFRLASATPTQK